MKVTFFGKLSDVLGREVALEVPPGRITIASIRGRLAEQCPDARDDIASPRLRACVNDAIVDESFLVEPGDAVEFFPPVSGG